MAYLKGIDVSKWQSTTPPLTGLSFLFARASIGGLKDERYAQHIANARKAGLVTGAYHFNFDGASVADQVRVFLAAAGDADLLALDVEGANAFNLAQTRAFIAGVQAKGRKCGLYMSDSSFYANAGQDFNWVAKWSLTQPNHRWDFWQYTSDGHIAGYTGRLDFNYFAGSESELRLLGGIPAAPDSATEEPMIVISDETPLLVDLKVGDQLLDNAGNPLVKVSVAQTQHSPFEAEFNPNFHARAFTISTGGQTVLAFVHTSDVTTHPVPAPVADCKQQIADAIAADRAKAHPELRVSWD